MNDRQLEREENALCEDLNSGRITQAEYNEQLRDLQREYRAACEEACQDAYNRERDNW